MLIHYYRAHASGSPTPPAGARFNGYTIDSSTALDETVTQSVVGDANDVLSIKVVTYTTNAGNINNFQINGVAKTINSTFGLTLDSSGNGSFQVYFKGGNSSGNYINVRIQIISASGANGIGSPDSQGYSKIV